MSSQPATSHPTFRLVTSKPAPESYRLERRASPRRPTRGLVTAVCTHYTDGTRLRRITRFELHDISETGIGASCDQPLPVGCRVALLMPPHGPEHGFDFFGKVVRCEPRGDQHEIGVALDQALSACA
jgi:hypothetical protein